LSTTGASPELKFAER